MQCGPLCAMWQTLEQLHPTLHSSDASLSDWPQGPAARELHQMSPSSLQHQKPVGDSLAVLYSSKTIEQMAGHFSTARGQCKPSIGNRPHLQQQVSSWRFATRARSLFHSFRRPYCFSGAVCVFVGSSGYVDPRGFDTKSKRP